METPKVPPFIVTIPTDRGWGWEVHYDAPKYENDRDMRACSNETYPTEDAAIAAAQEYLDKHPSL